MATMEYGTREVHDAAVEAIADRSDPRDRLVGLVAAHLACLHGTLRPYLVVVMNEFTRLYEVERRVLVSLRDGYETVWRTVLDDVAREGAGPTDPMLRLFLLGAVNHTYWWYDPDAGLDLATLADRLVGVVLPATPRQHSGGIA
jgi:hypothetical protein